MKQFDSAGIRGTPVTTDGSSRPIRRKGLLARLIEALHVSRQIEARRLIGRYRHLIAKDFRNRPKITVVNSSTIEENKTDADRDTARVHTDRQVLHHA
jgi:hypothetical protein